MMLDDDGKFVLNDNNATNGYSINWIFLCMCMCMCTLLLASLVYQVVDGRIGGNANTGWIQNNSSSK